MMHYLLIVNDCWDDMDNRIPAMKVAQHRLEQGLWSLYANTPHRKFLQAGDEVLIYLAGQSEGGKTFIAKAKVKGITTEPRLLLELYGEPPISAIMLENVDRFQNCPKISDIKDELEFVPKGTHKWGCVMQRGVKRIKEKDFSRIMAAARSSL